MLDLDIESNYTLDTLLIGNKILTAENDQCFLV